MIERFCNHRFVLCQKFSFIRISSPQKVGVHGFTLIELLMVVMIVAVLFVLSITSFSAVQKKAKSATCISNLRQLGSAVFRYSADKSGNIPPSIGNYEVKDGNGNSVGYIGFKWYAFLQYDNLTSYDNKGVLPNDNIDNSPIKLTVYNCPSNPYRAEVWRDASYAYNLALGYYNEQIAPGNPTSKMVRLGDLVSPTRTVMLTDAAVRGNMNNPPNIGPPKNVHYSVSAANWTTRMDFNLHENRANILFADGHVESLTADAVQKAFDAKTLLFSPDNSGSPDSYW